MTTWVNVKGWGFGRVIDWNVSQYYVLFPGYDGGIWVSKHLCTGV